MSLAAVGVKSGITYPNTIPSLGLWLRPEGITGLSDGATVATWPDSSGNGYDATQGTEANKPLFKTAVLGGKNAVRFDDSNDYLTASVPAATYGGNVSKTAFLVVNPGSGTNEAFFHYGETSVSKTFGMSFEAAGAYALFQWGDDVVVGAGASGAKVITGVKSNTAVSIYSDGTEVGTGTVLTANVTADTFRIGYLLSNAQPLGGDLAELILYGRALSDTERKGVERYLGGKYAIAIA